MKQNRNATTCPMLRQMRKPSMYFQMPVVGKYPHRKYLHCKHLHRKHLNRKCLHHKCLHRQLVHP